MAKRKFEIRMRSFGIYSKWDSDTKQLPKIEKFVTEVPAIVDIEFGFIVNIKGAKNLELDYCIDHPGIRDSQGNRRLPFDGTVYVKSNDWNFFLGDTVWEPIADKVGIWTLSLELDGKRVAEKAFNVFV